MKKQLQQRTREWMQLERKTLEQRRQADDFYEQNLLRLIEEDFLERNRNKLYEQAEYFVMSVGTSYEPIVLNLILFRPRHILFLYTEKTGQILNAVEVVEQKITEGKYSFVLIPLIFQYCMIF